jgi:hypothetical protein
VDGHVYFSLPEKSPANMYILRPRRMICSIHLGLVGEFLRNLLARGLLKHIASAVGLRWRAYISINAYSARQKSISLFTDSDKMYGISGCRKNTREEKPPSPLSYGELGMQ